MDFLSKLMNIMLTIILGAMSLVVAGNVFFRFILNSSLSWADEVAQMLLVWLTFIGAALAIKEKSHYVLNFLSEKLKGKSKRVFWMIQQLLTLFAIGVLLFFSAIVTWKIRLWVMPATEISRVFVYIACPIGCLLMFYFALKNMLNDYKENINKE